jgi:hypothetical protein
MMRLMEHVRELKNVYTILIRKLKEKRPLGRTMCEWNNSIKKDFRGIRCKGVE